GGEILVGTQGSGLLVTGAAGLRRPGSPDGFPLLPATFVDTLLAGGRGLWVGMPERLEFWDGGNPGSREPRARLALRGSPFALVTNAVGDLFVGGTHGQVWRLPGGDPRRGLEPLGPAMKAMVGGLLVVGETLWAATEVGPRTWNGRQWEGPPGGWAGGGARCLRLTRDGWLVIGTDLGLWVQAGTNGFPWPSGLGRTLPPVNQVVEDAAGHLWLGTARGLGRLGRDDLRRIVSGRAAEVAVSLRTKADGLPAQAFTYAGAAVLLPDQRLAFATQDGLLLMRPGPDRPAPPPPRVHITGVELDGVPFPIEPGVGRLPPLKRHATVAVRFEVVALESPGEARFRHRFGDLTTVWTPGGSEREVILNRPSAGRYPFQVETQAGDGSWHPAAELVLEFTPYWWEAAPARWAGGLLLMILPLGIQHSILRLRRLRRQRARALAQALQEERERIARDLHDHIGNRLSGIQAAAERLSLNGEASNSALLVGRLRQSSIEAVAMLEEAVRTLDSSRDLSWEDLAGLLQQETAGYAEAVGFRQDFTDSGPGPGTVSGLTGQILLSALRELLRNAHRHGAARHVRVSLASRAGWLRLVVEDDGVGFEAGAARQLKRGLAGMAVRVDAAKGRLAIESEPGRTRVEVEIPAGR
ncbi:MAG: ATP-binding protein, partial [Verrucomicrobiota bacterium]